MLDLNKKYLHKQYFPRIFREFQVPRKFIITFFLPRFAFMWYVASPQAESWLEWGPNRIGKFQFLKTNMLQWIHFISVKSHVNTSEIWVRWNKFSPFKLFFWVFPPKQDCFFVLSLYVFIIIASKSEIQYIDLSGTDVH